MVVTKVFGSQTNETIIALGLCALIVVLYSPDFGVQLSSGKAVEFLVLAGMLAVRSANSQRLTQTATQLCSNKRHFGRTQG